MNKASGSDFDAPLEITSLNHQGQGIASINGKAVFVTNALPGEKVMAVPMKRNKRYYLAQAVDVIQASAERKTPACVHFGRCGGCALQHMSRDAQIALKQHVLLEQLEHFAKVAPQEILPPLVGQGLAYRRKARIGVKFVDKKNKLLIGFREQNSRYLADLESCQIIPASVGEAFAALRECIMQLSDYRSIPQIEIAQGDDVMALIFRHLKPLTDADVQQLQALGKAQGFHIYCQPKGPDTVHKIWPEQSPLHLTYTLPAFDLCMQFHPLDFIQVNADVNEQMLTRVVDLLDLQPEDHVLDCFSGLGNFTLPIAQKVAKVVGVEGCAQMQKQLLANAQHNDLNNVEAYAADLNDTIEHFPWAKQTYDKIVLDPPRAGALALVEQLSRFKAKKIIYIACHPATLARDTQAIIEQGYQLQAAGVMDMFPHTTHVESIAVFNLID